MILPRERLIGVMEVVSNAGLATSRVDLERVVHSSLRMRVADKLAHVYAKPEVGDYSTKYRLELYVFTPDELARVIEQAAMEMARRYAPLPRDA